jgi:hypothetical protein
MKQFGFYQVGDQEFYSKFEALQANRSVGLISWNFNELSYSSYNWRVEPTESLEELYRLRAQQIREKYDYIVLWFSGGADSSTVLKSFIDNDIKIDECVGLVNYEATGDKFNFLNGEIYNVSIPKIEQARLKQPWLKHTLIDLPKLIMDRFTQKDTKFDWVYQLNGYLNPNNSSKVDIKLTQPHWRDMITAGKRVCFVHGIDKPRVTKHKEHYYYRFVDLVDTAVSAQVQMLNRPWDFDELFYWSPDAPLIPIKQAHIIKKYLAMAKVEDLSTDIFASTAQTHINGKNYSMTLDAMHRLIYPGWYPVLYQAKAPSLLFTPRDEWFFKLPDSDPAKYSWRTGLEYIWSQWPDQWKKDPSDMSKGFIPMNSKLYDLGM